MFRRESSWNLRDTHMVETLAALVRFFDARGQQPKSRVVGPQLAPWRRARDRDGAPRRDQRGTARAASDYAAASVSVGFTTYAGTVTAATTGTAPAERKRVRDALRGSVEDLLHTDGRPEISACASTIPCCRRSRCRCWSARFGVIYLPEAGRHSHYFHARVADQFDALIHVVLHHGGRTLERTAPGRPPSRPRRIRPQSDPRRSFFHLSISLPRSVDMMLGTQAKEIEAMKYIL